jgi:pimeloyl-ACP methyl ester carboxylesterase
MTLESIMWPVLLFALTDSLTLRTAIPVAPAESVAVTISGSGSPVVFVPGLVGSAFGFRHVHATIATDTQQLLVIEPLGFGRSGRPAIADYSLTAQADRVASALDSLGIGRAVFVAHSVSGSIVYRLALVRPELVAGIISVEGGVTERPVTPGMRLALKFAPLLKLLGSSGLRRQLVRNLRESSVDPAWLTPEVVNGYTQHVDDVGAVLAVLKGMARASEPWALGPRLHELRCPVRLLVGPTAHRGSVPRDEIELLQTAVPDFQVIEVEETGHFVFEERPDAVVAAVRALTAASIGNEVLTSAQR